MLNRHTNSIILNVNSIQSYLDPPSCDNYQFLQSITSHVHLVVSIVLIKGGQINIIQMHMKNAHSKYLTKAEYGSW